MNDRAFGGSVPAAAAAAPTARAAARPASGRWLDRLGRIGVHLLLLAGALTMLAPLLWMVSTSLKEAKDIFLYPPALIPNPATFENYRVAFSDLPFGRAYFNSLYIATVVTLGNLLTCSMAGYAFARLRFPGRDALFAVVLASLIIPFQITILPSFVVFSWIGWLDTHWPLIVPAILTNPFGVFLMRQFIRTLPRDLEDAARVDGAGPWRVYWEIVLPLTKPALSAVGIFTFMGSFNDFLAPLVYLNSPDRMTVPVLLAAFQGIYGVVQWGPLMAAATVALVPVLVVYVFAQRFFIEGITLTGMKG